MKVSIQKDWQEEEESNGGNGKVGVFMNIMCVGRF